MKQNNQLQIFKNEEFGQLRVIAINGKEYFYGVDIASALGYERPSKAISDHCKGILKQDTIKNEGGYPEKLIPEGDIYRLIMKSKLPSAEKFESWVVDEVLPSIRKHGAYMTEATIEKALTSPDFLIQLATQLKKEQEARKLAEETAKKQEKVIENLTPQAVIGDRFTNTNNSWDMNRFAKTLNIKGLGRNNLFAYLRNKEILRYNNEPYQRYMDADYFNVVQVSDGKGHESSKTLVKSKGINFIVKKLIKDGYIVTKSVDEILEELNKEN